MFGGQRCFLSQFEFHSNKIKFITNVRQYALPKEADSEVIIPKRIEREPTDILRALSNTVQRDFTAYDYRLRDDPYLTRGGSAMAHTLMKSLEFGRSSAKWIVKNHPELFNHQVADPLIPEFLPKPVYDENSEITEDVLINLIKERDVLDAIKVYNLCETKKIEVSEETKLLLLALTCFYNNREKHNEHEKWNQTSEKGAQSLENKIWEKNGFAENLYKSLAKSCPLACVPVIIGRLKYSDFENGTALFEEAKKSNIELPVSVYNEVMNSYFYLNSLPKERIGYILDTLKEMAERNIRPNLYTLNATLKAISRMGNLDWVLLKALSIVNEFQELGIQPSLGTYTYLLIICYGKDNFFNRTSSFMEEIVEKLDKEDFEVRHPSDSYFFLRAMSINYHSLNNLELAENLVKLVFKNDNIKFLANPYDLEGFFSYYFCILIKNETLDKIIEKYKLLVPSVYNMDLFNSVALLNRIKEVKNLNYLVEIWDILKIQGFDKNNKFLNYVLDMSSDYEIKKGDKVSELFYEVADFRFSLLPKAKPEGNVGSNMLIIFLKFRDRDKALIIFNDKSNFILNSHALETLFNYCIEEKDYPLLVECLKHSEEEYCTSVTERAKEVLPLLSRVPNIDIEFVKNLAQKAEEKAKKESTKK